MARWRRSPPCANRCVAGQGGRPAKPRRRGTATERRRRSAGAATTRPGRRAHRRPARDRLDDVPDLGSDHRRSRRRRAPAEVRNPVVPARNDQTGEDRAREWFLGSCRRVDDERPGGGQHVLRVTVRGPGRGTRREEPPGHRTSPARRRNAATGSVQIGPSPGSARASRPLNGRHRPDAPCHTAPIGSTTTPRTAALGTMKPGGFDRSARLVRWRDRASGRWFSGVGLLTSGRVPLLRRPGPSQRTVQARRSRESGTRGQNGLGESSQRVLLSARVHGARKHLPS